MSVWTVKTLQTHLILNLQRSLCCRPRGPDSAKPLCLSQLGEMPAPVSSVAVQESISPRLHVSVPCSPAGPGQTRRRGGAVRTDAAGLGGGRLGLFLGVGGRGGLLRWIFLFSPSLLFSSPLSTLAEPCSQLNESRAECNHISSCLCFWILGNCDLYLFLEKI